MDGRQGQSAMEPHIHWFPVETRWGGGRYPYGDHFDHLFRQTIAAGLYSRTGIAYRARRIVASLYLRGSAYRAGIEAAGKYQIDALNLS